MTQSPVSDKTDLVSFTIKVDGKPIKDVYQVHRFEVSKAVNRIPSATIDILDGSKTEETFAISESDDFKPGVELEIFAGYQSVEKSLFKGILLKHAIRASRSGDSFLTITCFDRASKMTVGRNSACYQQKKHSDTFTTILNAYGLEKDIEATTIQYEEIVQYYSTDWDYIVSTAEVNGQIVIVSDGKVSIGKPDVSGVPALEVKYGSSIKEFDLELDAQSQITAVSTWGWDGKSVDILSQDSSEPKTNKQGNNIKIQ